MKDTELFLTAIRDLMRAMAMSTAYQLAKESCLACGMPATKAVEASNCELLYACDKCDVCKGKRCTAEYTRDIYNANGIRRLMKIASGE